MNKDTLKGVKVKVIVENTIDTSLFLTGEHGLSFLIDNGEEKILFDTGQGMSIMNNLNFMGINAYDVNKIVFSHGHYDHTRGIKPVLEAGGRKKIFAHPDIFEKKYFKGKRKGIDREVELFIGLPYSREDLEKEGVEFVLSRESQEVSENIYTTGEIPLLNDFEEIDKTLFVKKEEEYYPDPLKDDLALVIQTSKGVSIVLGCAHRGVINTIEHVSKLIKSVEFYALIGGTHLMSADEERIKRTVDIIKKYNFKKVAPCHCTGLKGKSEFYRVFGENFVDAGVGTVIDI